MAPVDATGRAQTVLVLGGRSDIGQAIAQRFVDDGARRIVLASRDPDHHPAWSPVGAEVDHLPFDAADTADHADFFHRAFERHPGIDVVVVAFGVLHDQRATEETPELAVEMADVNLTGAASALLHAARHLRRRGSGRLVVLSSIAGWVPRRSNFSYGATKAGVDFFSRGLAQSLRGTEVDVLVVRPGFVHTAMTEGMESAPFAVTPERVADAVADALARRDEVVWVPPILRWVAAILRLLPPSVVRRLDR